MKRAIGFAFLALVALSLTHILNPSLEAQWGNQPRNGVCFYMDENYGGESVCANAGEERRNVGDRYNDRFSSLRIYGRVRVTVYNDQDFGGAAQSFTSDVRNLQTWNDRITSFKVVGISQSGVGGIGYEPREGVCLYADENYRGESFCLNAGESQHNVGRRYNDRFSSLRLFGGARITVYDDADYGGGQRTFTANVPNLRDWNDRITSFQVQGSRGPFGNQSIGYEPRDGACFYTDENYRGEGFCMNAGESLRNVQDRFNDRISSIRVFGGARAVIYENENFSGASRRVDRDVSNLGNFNDRLTSIEVR